MLNSNTWISHLHGKEFTQPKSRQYTDTWINDWTMSKFNKNAGRLLHTQGDTQSLALTAHFTFQIHWDSSGFPVTQQVLNPFFIINKVYCYRALFV